MSLNKHDTIYRSYQLLTWLLLNCLSHFAASNMTCSKQFRGPWIDRQPCFGAGRLIFQKAIFEANNISDTIYKGLSKTVILVWRGEGVSEQVLICVTAFLNDHYAKNVKCKEISSFNGHLLQYYSCHLRETPAHLTKPC